MRTSVAFLSIMALAIARAVAFDVRAIGVLLLSRYDVEVYRIPRQAATDYPWEPLVRSLHGYRTRIHRSESVEGKSTTGSRSTPRAGPRVLNPNPPTKLGGGGEPAAWRKASGRTGPAEKVPQRSTGSTASLGPATWRVPETRPVRSGSRAGSPCHIPSVRGE